MELRQSVGIFTKQSLAITPEVIQSIRILQYGREELESFLQDQSERNPLIEVVTEDHTSEADIPEPSPRIEANDRGQAGSRTKFDSDYTSSRKTPSAGAVFGIEHYCEAPVTMGDYLLQMAGLTFCDQTELIIAGEVIGSLDTDGYFRRDLKEMSARLGCTVPCVEKVLTQIQQFHPAGIAARNLSECLALQLREKDRLDPAMNAMLANLELLAKFEYEKLSKLCGVSVDDIFTMAREIKQLDPRPGRVFDTSPTQVAIPDVYVSCERNGTYRVDLNTSQLPKVLVNQRYYAKIDVKQLGDSDKKYVMDCMSNANWLVRNLEQRAQTILKVASAIVTQQSDFFAKGVDHLRPLNLRDVAAAVGVHESTVCRAIANKYIMTHRGMFEMRYFFATGIASVDGESELSSETVRRKISALIKAETARTVMSDEAIVKSLRGEGVEIARRTIAKYRDLMGIPSSLQRKRRKLAEERT